jgi:sortase A
MLNDEQVMRSIRVRLEYELADLVPPADLFDRVRDQAGDGRRANTWRSASRRRGELVALSMSVLVVVVVAAGALLMFGNARQRHGSPASSPSSNQMIRRLAEGDLARIETGDVIGQVDLPRLGHKWNIIQGTNSSDLVQGPGHLPGTALPGMDQTVAIAGYRRTHLAPFRFIDTLARGDHIAVTMPYGAFTYVVQSHETVQANDTRVIRNVGYDRLVLSAGDPAYSARRWIVFARLQAVKKIG